MRERILIGTDLLLAYLLNSDYSEGITIMFRWMRKTSALKMIDKGSIAILTNFINISAFSRLRGFEVINTIPKMSTPLQVLSKNSSMSSHDTRALLLQLNLLKLEYVDLLITENQFTHQLATLLNIDDRVLKIEEYLEICVSEHRNMDEMRSVVLKEVAFGSLSLDDSFFRTFIDEYKPYYFEWFKKKAFDPVYVARDKDGRIRALLKLKIESESENFKDILPVLPSVRWLKICSLKVDYSGQKLGERFMRIIFDKSLTEKVDGIYITIFANSPQRKRLIGMIQMWGFEFWGMKNHKEEVYVRDMRKREMLGGVSLYPFSRKSLPSYILPVEANFADLLVPVSKDRNNLIDYEPFKNAIKKVLVLENSNVMIPVGATLFFYRKGKNEEESGFIASGIVDGLFHSFDSEKDFLARCKKRSILSLDALHDYWTRFDGAPMVINFLHNYSFDKNEISQDRLTQACLKTESFMNMRPTKLTPQQISILIQNTSYEKNIVIG